MKKMWMVVVVITTFVGFCGCEKTPVETDVKVRNGGEGTTDFVVVLTLKSSFRHDYLLVEDSVIKALLAKYLNNGIELYPSYPGAKNKELFRSYTLRATDNGEIVLQDFLATGYFEDEYKISEIVEICVVNSKSTWGF